LIVDLCGNTGGGIGGLRLTSYLTPRKPEVGYSLTRKRRERGYKREELTRFGRIPAHKATLLWLAARYDFVEKSILVVTEGFGERRFHGRIVLLVSEHTASAGEMVSAFAEENNLAVIVGTKTPGLELIYQWGDLTNVRKGPQMTARYREVKQRQPQPQVNQNRNRAADADGCALPQKKYIQ
jgi:C-terminal processing protease CtpA/Prc